MKFALLLHFTFTFYIREDNINTNYPILASLSVIKTYLKKGIWQYIYFYPWTAILWERTLSIKSLYMFNDQLYWLFTCFNVDGCVDKKFQSYVFYRTREIYVSSNTLQTDISSYRVASLQKIGIKYYWLFYAWK